MIRHKAGWTFIPTVPGTLRTPRPFTLPFIHRPGILNERRLFERFLEWGVLEWGILEWGILHGRHVLQKLKHTIHNATAVCPKENAEAYTFLLRSSLRFKHMEAVLNNESYNASSKAARARVHPSQPCVLKPNTDGVYRISSSSPFNSLRLTIFHPISSVKLLKHFDVFRAGRAMIREGGSTSRDLYTSASYIVGYVSCDACFQTRIS